MRAEYIRVKACSFSNLALGQQCAWAVAGDVSVPQRDNTFHCWEGGENCDASFEFPVTNPYKSEFFVSEEVESRGFVWNGNFSTSSSRTVRRPAHFPVLWILLSTGQHVLEQLKCL